jgi:molybdopterin-guanine dinucleotide biosynthesis protein A
MGRDKALLPFRGSSLVQWVAGEVASAAGEVTLVGSPERYADLGLAVIADLFPGAGPLGGILTALRHSGADWNLLVACDMPEVSAASLTGLLLAAERCDGDALVPAGPSGLLEPLCAVYHRRAHAALQAAFDRGTRKVTAALEGLRTAVFPVADLAAYQNVNTPEEWAGYGAS